MGVSGMGLVNEVGNGLSVSANASGGMPEVPTGGSRLSRFFSGVAPNTATSAAAPNSGNNSRRSSLNDEFGRNLSFLNGEFHLVLSISLNSTGKHSKIMLCFRIGG